MWTLHNNGVLEPDAVVKPTERLSWGRTIGLGAQHVVAMFGATFVFPLLMGLNAQLAVMMSGVATLIFLFAVTLGWLPARGPYSAQVTPGFNMPFIASVLRHAILPVLAYFLTTVANWTIGMRANALGSLGEDYVAYARARGLSQRRILIHYVGRNSILPMITSLAISFGFMFGGSPLIENLFLYPGVGYYLNQAIARRDYPLMQGMYFIMIVVVVLSGLLAERLYTVLNPRLRER